MENIIPDNGKPAEKSVGEILYEVSGRHGIWDLDILKKDGKSSRLTNTPKVNEMRAIWSPDGSKIAITGENLVANHDRPGWSG